MTRFPVGPVAVLACCILPAFGAFAIRGVSLGLVCVAAELVAFGWLAVEPRAVAFRLGLALVAATSITASTWLYGGHDLDPSAGAGLRILYLALPSVLLTGRIRPSPLGDQLAQRLRLPARVVVASVAALQRLETLGEQWRQIQRARRARGLGVDGGLGRRIRSSAGAAFTMLVVTMRHTGAMAMAMDARGFAHAGTRTWAEDAPWRWPDPVMAAVAAALAVGPWLLR